MSVEDEAEVLKLFKMILQSLGVEVLTMEDSHQAAERTLRERFDTIFVDAHTYHLDGFGLTRRIRASQLNCGTLIVMVTESDDGEIMKESFKTGVTFPLGKPIDSAKLRGLLNVPWCAILRERRRHARLPFRSTVDGRFVEQRFMAMSVNLGANGMALEGCARAGVQADKFPAQFLTYVIGKEHEDYCGNTQHKCTRTFLTFHSEILLSDRTRMICSF